MKRVTRIYIANFNAHFSCGFFLSVQVTTCQLTGIDGAAHTLCVGFVTRPTDSFCRGCDLPIRVRRARLTLRDDLIRMCHCHCHCHCPALQ